MTKMGVFLRGMLMGAADVVPGVSGGTMALITGIYATLLNSIRSFDVAALRLLLRGDLKALWQHVNAGFLVALLAGIATSIATFARGIGWLLEYYPVPLWAFFFGLILASAVALARHVKQWQLITAIAFAVGTAIALTIGLSPQVQLGGGYAGVLLAGFLAICAMILPGISGSFILLLLGMYAPVLGAIARFDVVYIAMFMTGAVAGLLCFSRLLHYLLSRFASQTMALLTGFLAGSLVVVWPWKRVLSSVIDRHGELRPVHQLPVSPQTFEAAGGDARLFLCLALVIVGIALVWLLESRYGQQLEME